MSEIRVDEEAAFALPVGTVTFLLTDIAGSTSMWEADPTSAAKAVARHYDLIAEAVGRHGGVRPVEQGEGDSVVAAFARASDGLAAALEAQQALHLELWPEGVKLAVRMALHTGEAQLRDKGNYFGQAVNRCARVRALAHGGQVVLSRATHDLVADRLPSGVILRDLGTHRLRDLGRPEHVFQLCHPDLPDAFPALVSLDAVANNLPIQLTSFVGRAPELLELRGLLDSTRLLTFTGSGGCGKTRLALQAAAERFDHHPDGIWYIELAPLGETTSVARTIADALNIPEEADRQVVDTVTERMRDWHAMVLIDNCEHLLAQAAAVIDDILRSCPAVQVVATSREPLNLAGEVPWRVPSLTLPGEGEPEPLDALVEYDAVRLFVERATKTRPNFRLTEANASAVAQLCRRLDGIPLAIELAAARTRALSPEQIVRGLDDRFRLLTGGARTLLPRQQTLRASVDWSHHLLSEPEQAVFRRLSVFAGGFTLDAAEAVASGGAIERFEVLDLLAQLVDRSLVQTDDTSVDVRYRLLETIKQYGRERIEEADELTPTRDAHLTWFAGLADRARPCLITGEQEEWLIRLDADHDNLRAALEWAAASFDLDPLLAMAVDLTFFWFLAGHFQEGNGWLERALAETGTEPSPLRARARWGMAYLNYYAGNIATAMDVAKEALAWAEAVDDDFTRARALDTLASMQSTNDPATALPALRDAVERATAAGDEWCRTNALQKAAWCFMYQDRYDEAIPLMEEALVGARRLGNNFFLAWHWLTVGYVGIRRGDIAAARPALAAAVRAAHSAQEPATMFFAIWYQAEGEMLAGAADDAVAIVVNCESAMARRGVVSHVQTSFGSAAEWVRFAAGQTASTVMQQQVVDTVAESMLAFEGVGLPMLAETLLASGEAAAARRRMLRLLEVGAALDNPRMTALGHALLARADEAGGDTQAAEGHAHHALALFDEHGFLPDLVDTVDLLASLAAGAQSWIEAARLLGSIEAIRANRGWARWPVRQTGVDATAAAATAALGVEQFAAATADGASLDLDALIAYASRSRGERGRPASGWGSLTPTELEVVKLVAEGLTNPQIGERMLIARGTVKVHLYRVFTKLGYATRSELASEATRRQL